MKFYTGFPTYFIRHAPPASGLETPQLPGLPAVVAQFEQSPYVRAALAGLCVAAAFQCVKMGLSDLLLLWLAWLMWCDVPIGVIGGSLTFACHLTDGPHAWPGT